MVLACLAFAKYAGNKIWQIPTSDKKQTRDKSYVDNSKTSSVYDETNLPSAFLSFAPIIVPIILILLGTVTGAMKLEGKIVSIIQFIGTPVLAVGIGLLITIYGLTRSLDKQRVLEEVEIGIFY